MKKQDADTLFRQQAQLKPGLWVRHSEHAAMAAQQLAAGLHMDEEEAYVLGLLHDIGRSLTDGQFQHIACGYALMMHLNEPKAARICVTHSFPVQNLYSYAGIIDIPADGQQFYAALLSSFHYDEYDRLIQLVDALSTPDGYISIARRQKKLAEKYGPNPFAREKLAILETYYARISQRLQQDVLQYLILHQ
ncbi:MAG: HDOD domain-containing protein [Erysipelotrichaceae bacterium]|nr:HDOD domain-containing protein [Erysipelotrichaceae bacterium]